MSHLTMEQLLDLREPGIEPGQSEARTHMDECPLCQEEAHRLGQRMARLRALPSPRPTRDQFLQIRRLHVAERVRGRARLAGLGGLALAASVALVVLVRSVAGPSNPGAAAATELELAEVMTRSQTLEAALHAWDPDSRVLDGRTAGIAARLEARIGEVDREIELLTLLNSRATGRRSEQVRLWRERVGLLDALVDVHMTRASYLGL